MDRRGFLGAGAATVAAGLGFDAEAREASVPVGAPGFRVVDRGSRIVEVTDPELGKSRVYMPSPREHGDCYLGCRFRLDQFAMEVPYPKMSNEWAPWGHDPMAVPLVRTGWWCEPSEFDVYRRAQRRYAEARDRGFNFLGPDEPWKIVHVEYWCSDGGFEHALTPLPEGYDSELCLGVFVRHGVAT